MLKLGFLFKRRIYIYIIIIIMSRRQRGYPWPSLAISPYHSSPPAGLQGYILCPHIVAVCMFVLVVPLLHIHMWGSTGVHRLWARPCFSSSVLRVWYIYIYIYNLINIRTCEHNSQTSNSGLPKGKAKNWSLYFWNYYSYNKMTYISIKESWRP